MAVNYRKERIDRGIKARTDDIFALSSYREALYLLIPRVLPVLLLLLLPLFLGIYWTKVMILTCVIAILALSWDMMFAAGMISLGQSLFFGAGAYIAGSLNHYFGFPPILSIPIATVAGGVLSTVLLTPVLRLRGIYFAMITLALSLMFVRIIEATRILGGTAGLTALEPFPDLKVEIYLVLVVVLLCLFGFRRLISTDYGLVLKGIGENDRAVMSSGINIYWFKAQTLFIGTAAAAFAGAFMTHYNMQVGMGAFALDNSVLPLASVVVGGPGTFAGAVLGAFILVPLSEFFRAAIGLRAVLYSLAMVVFVVALPEGIFHYLQRRYHQFNRMVEV